jgi:hypothetical protein
MKSCWRQINILRPSFAVLKSTLDEMVRKADENYGYVAVRNLPTDPGYVAWTN